MKYFNIGLKIYYYKINFTCSKYKTADILYIMTFKFTIFFRCRMPLPSSIQLCTYHLYNFLVACTQYIKQILHARPRQPAQKFELDHRYWSCIIIYIGSTRCSAWQICFCCSVACMTPQSGEAMHATFAEHIKYKLPKNYTNDKYTADLKRAVVSQKGKRL